MSPPVIYFDQHRALTTKHDTSPPIEVQVHTSRRRTMVNPSVGRLCDPSLVLIDGTPPAQNVCCSAGRKSRPLGIEPPPSERPPVALTPTTRLRKQALNRAGCWRFFCKAACPQSQIHKEWQVNNLGGSCFEHRLSPRLLTLAARAARVVVVDVCFMLA